MQFSLFARTSTTINGMFYDEAIKQDTYAKMKRKNITHNGARVYNNIFST